MSADRVATCDVIAQVKLGTIEQSHADNEFSLRPFVRSARKRSFLETD
jgi:hypothetical protein